MSDQVMRAIKARNTGTPRPGGIRTARARGGDRGAAAVEFALVVPFLILLTFGLIQYGFYFWAKQGGSDLTRSAARLSAVGNPATCADFRSIVGDSIEDFGASRGTPTIQRSYAKGPGNTASAVQVGDVVTVTVSFESIDLGMPMLPFVDGGRVSETVEARVDYVPTQPEPCP